MDVSDVEGSNGYDFSDSDCLTTTSSTQQSTEIQNLKSANEKLKFELEGYKRQYEESLSYLKQFEELQTVVTELRKENTKLVAEKDELARRLEISLMKNDELTRKETHEQVPNFVLEISQLKHQMKCDKEEHENKLKEVNKIMQERSDLLDTKTKELDQLQAMLNRILSAAQDRFGSTFPTATDFHNFLVKPAPEAVKPKPTDSEQVVNDRDELLAKIKYFKKLAKTQMKCRKKMEGVCDAVTRESQMRVAEADKIVTSLEKQITDVQEEVKQRDDLHKQELATRDAEIKTLRAELDKARRNIQSMKEDQTPVFVQPQACPPPSEANEWCEKAQAQAAKLKEARNNIDSMRKRIMFLSSQVKTLETEKKALERKGKELETRIDELTSIERDWQAKYEALQTEKDELDVQLSYNSSKAKAEQACSSKAKVKVEALSNELSQVKMAVAKSEHLIEYQKKEIAKYNKERQRILGLLEKHNALAQTYDQRCCELKQEVAELRKKLKAEQTKPLLKPAPQPEEKREQVPWSVWAHSDLPKPVLDKIIQIAKLNDLPLSHRIPQIMSMIVSHYKDVIQENEVENNRLKDQFDSQVNAINRFLSAVGKVVEQCNLSVALIQDPFAAHDVIEKITKLRQSITDAQEQAAAQEEKTLSLLVKLQADTVPDAITQIDDMVKYCTCLESKVKKLVSKNAKLAAVHRQMSKELETQKAEHHDITTNHMQELEDKEKERLALANTAKRYEQQIASLTSEIEQLRVMNNKRVTEQSDDVSRRMERLTMESQQQKVKLDAEIQEHRQAVERAERETERAAREIDQWKRTVMHLKSVTDAKESQIQQLLAEMAEQERQASEKSMSERKMQQAKYEQIIGDLRSKNTSLSKFLDETANALAETECKVKELLCVNSQLTIEKNQAIAQCETQRDEMKREKQLADTKLKAIELSKQMQIQSLTEQQNAKIELAKHEAFSMIANAFRRYFDPRNQLDKAYVQSLLEKVSSDLDRLLRQDAEVRSIIGINGADSIQEAVARILLSAYH